MVDTVAPVVAPPLTRRQALAKVVEHTNLVAMCDNWLKYVEQCSQIKTFSPTLGESTWNINTPEQRNAVKAVLETIRQQTEDKAQEALAHAAEAEVI